MYEEGKKSFSLNWGSLLIKLVILAVIVFIAGWIYVRVTGNNSSSKKNTLADNSEYINNINTMKTAAFEYFTKSKLPEKVGASEKVTLAEMINQKLLIDFTNDGKTCDTNSSYVQTTKTADGNYALKVSLTCGDESDFIVTTIEKETCENNCNSNNENKSTTEDKKSSSNSSTSNNTNSSNSSSSSNSNKEATNSSSNSSTSSSSSSSSSNKKTTTTTTTTTTTITKITYKCINSCCTTSCNNNSEKNETKSEKVRYYKYVKYSDWIDGYSSNTNATNKQEYVKTYNYCKQNEYEKTYYVTDYVNKIIKSSNYDYDVYLKDIPSDAENVTLVKNSDSYFNSNNTADYQNYIYNRNNIELYSNKGKDYVSLNNAFNFRDSSLKKSNFKFSVDDDIYYDSNKNYWTTNVKIRYKNADDVTPYYSSNISKYIYFIPIKFTVSYTLDDSCVRDTESNASKYSNYSKTECKYETVWKHKNAEYVWSKETKLDGYTYTGEYEDRTA